VRSRTKRDLSAETLQSLVREGLGDGRRVAASRELTDGMFNAAYRLVLDDGDDVVLKVSPPAGTPLLTYERDIMRTEALFFELCAPLGVPVPPLRHAGFARQAVDGDYLITGALDGSPWDKVKKRLSARENAIARRDLGRWVARLHTVTGDHFGYPQPAAGLRGDTWREAFLAMVSAVLADADRFSADLPMSTSDIGDLVASRAGVLDAVERPVLVHFDLWDGNIFLDLGGGEPRVEGLIDPERAFWGDPHAEMVSLALFGDIAADSAFLAGYAEGGGTLDFTPDVRVKLALYRTYLYLIMAIEGVPRDYSGVKHWALRKYVLRQLSAQLRRLAA
jgi:aminoglycoside phosphotransferase (APT) family kinase protein